MINLWKELLEQIGLNPERLQIGWVSSAEGDRFAKIMSDFTEQLKHLGSLWTSKGEDAIRLKLRLEAAKNLVPYIKLVENNKLRLPLGSEEGEYNEFFSREEVRSLFHELIVDKLRMSEILLLLRGKCLSIKEIAEILELNPSEVLRCVIDSAKRGLVRVDKSQQRFTVA